MRLPLVRSMKTESVDHEVALRLIHSREAVSWPAGVEFVGGCTDFGSLRQDLPAYVVLSDPAAMPVDGPHNWSSGFCRRFIKALPSERREFRSPICSRRRACPLRAQKLLEFLHSLNTTHQQPS